ncbi:MAG: GFA family protein [Pseudomonadota bacterium]
MSITGGCLCGAVRWAYDGPVNWTAHCHCESCRRNCAAPVTTYVGVPREAFRWTGVEAGVYNSSPGVRRHFCGTCGTPVAFDADHYAHEIHLYAAGHDDPEALVPQVHVFATEALSWLHIEDGLRRFPASGNSGGIGA